MSILIERETSAHRQEVGRLVRGILTRCLSTPKTSHLPHDTIGCQRP